MNKPKKKILIVDDDSEVRESISLAIKEQDYLDVEISESSDVATGIKQMEKDKPDIVILDLHLPDKSGFDFMDIMHKNKDLAKTKVIMISVDDTLINMLKAETRGIEAFHFIGKPFNISDLQALVFDVGLSK